jgi:hypothetical protein
MTYRGLTLDDPCDLSHEAWERRRAHHDAFFVMKERVAGGERRSAEIDDEPPARRAQVKRRSDRSGLRFPYYRAEARQIPDEEWGRSTWERHYYGAGTMRDFGVYVVGKLPAGVEYHRDPDVALHGAWYAKYLDNRKAA